MTMAAPAKKRDIPRNFEDRNSNDNDQSLSNNEDNKKELLDKELMEIQIDFEGRTPMDLDSDGIKTLLRQLFLKAHIDLADLVGLIICQNYAGSVLKQSEDIDESDDEDSDINTVFGVNTVINLSTHHDSPCIFEIRHLLKQLANEHATDAVNTMIQHVLDYESDGLGLLINERFVNISAQISVPLWENLISEINKEDNKEMPFFNFSHYILICKLYKTEDKKLKYEKKDNIKEPTIIWSNPEEEIFAEEATISFEFSVENETDSGLSGTWTETDDEMIPYRRVLLFEATKLRPIVDKIKKHFLIDSD